MNLAPNCPIDLDKLLSTRALIVANSGGGKSYALRRLIEQTAVDVQQFVIDTEGEFASLREKFDYVYAAAAGGDVLASPKTAAVLARKLLELKTSAILDIYDLSPVDRQTFVKNFCDALVTAPRELHHPVLVVLDEAHLYVPQNGSAIAQDAVTNVATRGRKRGLCLVLATQRLSKLHKDTAAEMINKLIGRTTLDVDRKRAAEEMGITSKEAVTTLRNLQPGEFFAFGPAFTEEVTKIKVAKVATAHANTSKLQREAPKPSANVVKVLAKLGDLPKEAQREAETIAELRAEIAQLKRDARKPEAPDKAALQEAFDSGFLGGQVEAEKQFKLVYAQFETAIRKCLISADQIRDATRTMPAFPTAVIASPSEKKVAEMRVGMAKRRRGIDYAAEAQKVTGGVVGDGPIVAQLMANDHALEANAFPLKAGARKMLRELAARHPQGYTRRQLGALVRIKASGSTFSNYMSDLRRGSLIEEREGQIFASSQGLELAGPVDAPTTPEAVVEQWKQRLKAGARKMLDAIVAAGAEGMHRANLADIVNIDANGSTFSNYMSDIRTTGLIVEKGKRIYPIDLLL
jgi:hypothetical protein